MQQIIAIKYEYSYRYNTLGWCQKSAVVNMTKKSTAVSTCEPSYCVGNKIFTKDNKYN